MHRTSLLLLVVAILLAAAGALLIPGWLEDGTAPTLKWKASDEQDVPEDVAEAARAAGDDGSALQRSAAELPATVAADEDRVELLLSGRVVDKFTRPVAAATVWLDFGRTGRGGANNRQRRVPEPVTTDREGRFAFQGQAFRNLRVNLQVAHERHAPAQFAKDVGAVASAVDLGDLVLMTGGEVRGRVTDLDGNGVAAAALTLQPENSNPLRMLRERERLLPVFTTDANGFYRRPHLGSGDWSLAASAKRHTEGRSATFVVEEDQVVEIEDIRLGPGYELAGVVRDSRGEPIAKATVTVQAEPRPRGEAGPNGNGGPGGGRVGVGPGRDHRTTTDAAGKFYLDHLPATTLRLGATADGYLDLRVDGIDPQLGQLLQLTLQDGLRIEGTVRDTDGSAVSSFAVRAVRLRGLPAPGQPSLDPATILTRMRDGNLSDAERAELRTQMEGLRDQFGGRGGRGDRGDRGPTNAAPGARADRGLDRPEPHPGGTFVAAGLQEGIYEVQVQSPDHARYRSAEIELRAAAAVPNLSIVLDGGVFVAGVVLTDRGDAVRGARVELRQPSSFEGMRRPGRDGQAGPSTPGAGATAPDFGGMAREFQRLAAGVTTTLEATTDAEGLFVIKHAVRGEYRLHAEADGFAGTATEPFELVGDRSGFELRLGSLGAIVGVLQGLRPEEIGSARVAAIPFPNQPGGGLGGLGGLFGRGRGGQGGGPLQGVAVAADGGFEIVDLPPGDYLVRGWVGSPQDALRELWPQFTDGSLRADLVVRAGETTNFDPLLIRPALGVVAGTVLHNGKAASGMQVELARQDESGSDPAGAGNGRGGRGGPGGFGGFGGFGRNFQSAVAASGRFQIPSVPPGSYRLRVQAARRGGVLHEEIVTVVANATTERNLSVTTCSLQGTVTAEAGVDAKELAGRVSLLAGVTTVPENLGQWQRENPSFDARLQNGSFRFEAVKPGDYLLVVTVRGRERTTQPVVLGGDHNLTVVAGKPATAPAAPTPGGGQGNSGR